jgi:hypothetical protein
MSRVSTPILALLSALRYELKRLMITRSTRSTGLLSLLGSALITLPAARSAVGPAHSQAAEIARLSGARLALNRGGMFASFGGGRFMTVRGDAVIGRSLTVPTAWLPRGFGITGATAVGHGGAGVLAPDSGLTHSAPSVAAMVGAHAGGAGVVAGGIVGAVLPATMAALGAAWIGASSITYEYRYGGGLITYVLVPSRSAVLLAKAIAVALVGAALCFGTTLVAYGMAKLGFTVAGTKIDVPPLLMMPAVREVAIAALCGALAVAVCAVLRVRLFAVLVSAGLCAAVAATLPGSASPLVPDIGRAVQFLVANVPVVSFREALFGVAVLWWATALMVVRRRRVG